MKLKDKIKKWYRGKHIPPRKNDPGSPVFIVSAGYYKPSVSAIIAKFVLQNWKTFLTALIALFAILVSLFIHFDKNSGHKQEPYFKQHDKSSEQTTISGIVKAAIC